MTNWYYYNTSGEKIEVTDKELKELAANGKITQGTMIESPKGKAAPAKKVKGLTFVEAVQPQTPPPSPSAAPNPLPATVPPTDQASSQSDSLPIATESKKTQWIVAVVILALIGMSWAGCGLSKPKLTKEQKEFADKIMKNGRKPTKEIRQLGLINYMFFVSESQRYKRENPRTQMSRYDPTEEEMIEMIKYALQEGANIHARGNGYTALEMARGKPKVQEFLRKKGAKDSKSCSYCRERIISGTIMCPACRRIFP